MARPWCDLWHKPCGLKYCKNGLLTSFEPGFCNCKMVEIQTWPDFSWDGIYKL